MKNDVHIIVCCILMLLSTLQIKSQYIHFSQPVETASLRNPALASLSKYDLQLQTILNTQLQNATIPYHSIFVNGEYKQCVILNLKSFTITLSKCRVLTS